MHCIRTYTYIRKCIAYVVDDVILGAGATNGHCAIIEYMLQLYRPVEEMLPVACIKTRTIITVLSEIYF